MLKPLSTLKNNIFICANLRNLRINYLRMIYMRS